MTIAPPATIVDMPIDSFRNSVPRMTATTGLTNAYVATVEMRTFFNSQAYAEKAISEPTSTRYAKAISGFVWNELARTSLTSPAASPAMPRNRAAASICIEADSNGLLGSGTPRA